MKKFTHKLLSILLTLTMVLSLVPAFSIVASATVADVNTTATVGDYTIAIPKGAEIPEVSSVIPTIVTSSSSAVTWSDTESNAGWYVVTDNDVTINNKVTVTGEVKLILCDGASLTVRGVDGANGESGQDGWDGGNAILGSSGNLTIYAGNTTAIIAGTGSFSAIGGTGGNGGDSSSSMAGFGGDGGSAIYCINNLTINGGTVTATGGAGGNGGTHYGSNEDGANGGPGGYGILLAGNFTIYGGNFNTTGGTGGNGGSTGYYVAGGGGGGSDALYLGSGTFKVVNGTVVATGGSGGKNSDDSGYGDLGSGIGAQNAEISDGAITTTGDYGISCRNEMTISGGNLQANGNHAIYSHYVTVDGGTVKAKGVSYAVRAETSLTLTGMEISGANETYIAGSIKELTNKSDTEYITISPKEPVCFIDKNENNVYDDTVDIKYFSIQAAVNACAGDEVNPATTTSAIAMIADSTENVTIPAGKNITLDLNGYVLKAVSTTSSVITNNGTLTIKDSNGAGKTYWFTKDDEDIYSVRNDSATTGAIQVTGGCITGGYYFKNGGDCKGGGIRNNYELSLLGGNIIGNMANYGGGVCVTSGASFTMTGGNILGNGAMGGGGVYIASNALLTMSGGVISNNMSGICGGGVACEDNGNITLGGTAEITDNISYNTHSTSVVSTQNLLTVTNPAITLNKPAEGMNVGVTLINSSYDATTGVFTTNGTEDDVQYFHSDTDIYEVKCVDSHLKLEIKDAYKWYYDHISEDEFTISNIDELEAFADIVNSGTNSFENKTVKLSDNFVNEDASGSAAALTTPIGFDNDDNSFDFAFYGSFDGNGKTIALDIDSDDKYVGLFGCVWRGTIENVNTSGTVAVTSTQSVYVGGVAGYLVDGTIRNCSSDCDITIEAPEIGVGGIVGHIGYDWLVSVVANCYAAGNIEATGSAVYLGGVAGENYSNVSNCYYKNDIADKGVGKGEDPCIALPDTQMKAIAGETKSASDVSTWQSITVGAISLGEVSMTDALNAYVANDSGNSLAYWGVMDSTVNDGYPVFTIDDAIYLVDGKAYSAYTDADTNTQIAMPEGITYDVSAASYTLTDVKLPFRYGGRLDFSKNTASNIKLVLSGENQLGVTASMSAFDVLYNNDKATPVANYGIIADGKTLTITGDTNSKLTIYDAMQGISADTINVGSSASEADFKGVLLINDYGAIYGKPAAPVCCLNATNVNIHSGTLTLNNNETHAIYASYITIDGGTINAKGGQAAVNASNSLTLIGMEVSGANETYAAGVKTLTNNSVAEYVTIKETAPVFDNRFGGDVTNDNYNTVYAVNSAYTVHDDVSYTFGGWYTGIDGTGTELNGEPQNGTTYYAKWINNGKTVVTKTLNFDYGADATDFAAGTNHANETGLSWEGTTLTLNGATVDAYATSGSGIRLSDDNAEIVITDDTINSISFKNNAETLAAGEKTVAVVFTPGKLNVSGLGTLTINTKAIASDAVTVGILTYGNAIFDEATLTINADSNPIYVADLIGLSSSNEQSRTLTISGGSITANAKLVTTDTSDYSIHVHKGNIIISGGTVAAIGGSHGIIAGTNSNEGTIQITGGTVSASSANSGIWAHDNIEISGGTVTTATTGTSGNDYGINSQAGNIVISGGAVTASGAEYGIRSKAGNVTIIGDSAVVTASGNTAAYYISSSGIFTAANAVIKTGADEANATVQSGDAKTAVTSAKYANVKFVILTVSFDAQNGSAVTTGSAYQYGTVAKPADPVKSGYTFGGWYKDEACEAAWNFGDDIAEETMTLYAKWIKDSETKAVITGTVTDGTNPVSGAIVELWLGTEKVAAAVTNASGVYSFDNVENGLYNIVIVKDGKTKTAMVNVDQASSFTANAVLPVASVNSKIELSNMSNLSSGAKADVSDVVVGGVDAVSESETPGAGEKITIVLTVEPKASDNSDATQAAIKTAAGNKTVEFVDFTLTRQINDGAKNDIGNTNTKILTIVLPFDTTGIDVSSITVYRHHDTAAALIKESAQMTTPVDGHFYVDTTNKLIYVYASQFSTYAIGYTKTSSQPTSSDGETVSTYSVTIADSVHGTVTANKNKTYADNVVTLTVKADDGYKLGTLKVTDEKGNSVTIQNNKFAMPSSNVTVIATFVSDTCPQDETCAYAKYIDADTKAWYHDGVHYCVENKIMLGTGNKFKPNDTIIRAEVIQLLYNMTGKPVTDFEMTFTDVAEGQWYTEAVRWAQSVGIAKGSEGKFKPTDAITREEFATMLYRYEQIINKGGFTGAWVFPITGFDDVDMISGWADEAMHWMTMNQIVQGSDGKINPTGNASRADVATMVQRFCTLEK